MACANPQNGFNWYVTNNLGPNMTGPILPYPFSHGLTGHTGATGMTGAHIITYKPQGGVVTQPGQYPLCPRPLISGTMEQRKQGFFNVNGCPFHKDVCGKCNQSPCVCGPAKKELRKISRELQRKYRRWKNRCDSKTYRGYRKFLEWQRVSNNIYDFANYYVWKQGNWEGHHHDNYVDNDYSAWRRAYDDDDLQSWHTWNNWKDRRSHYKRKHRKQHDKHSDQYDKNDASYYKYKKNANLKDYCKYRRFCDWQDFCNQYGYDLNNREAYQDWFKVNNKNYNNRKQYENEYYVWKNNNDPNACQNWKNWQVWKGSKGKKYSKTESTISSDNGSSILRRSWDNSSRGHRKYYHGYISDDGRHGKRHDNYTSDSGYGKFRRRPEYNYRRHKNY